MNWKENAQDIIGIIAIVCASSLMMWLIKI